MEVSKLQSLYLKLLYSRDMSCLDGSPEALYLARNVNVERLEVEAAARTRNLRSKLYSEMKFLPNFIDKDSMLKIVQSYCASPDFFAHRGRTLLEDFCLFFVKQPSLDCRLDLLARLEGVVSGMSILEPGKTPWEGNLQFRKNSAESLISYQYTNPKHILHASSLEVLKTNLSPVRWQVSKTGSFVRVRVAQVNS